MREKGSTEFMISILYTMAGLIIYLVVWFHIAVEPFALFYRGVCCYVTAIVIFH